MRDKISKIDKLEKSDKAQAIVNRASSGVKTAQKPAKQPVGAKKGKKKPVGAKLGGAKPDKQASVAKFGKQKPASAAKFDKGAKPDKQGSASGAKQKGQASLAKPAKKKPAIKSKSAAQKLAKSKLKSSFALGSVFASAEKIAKIEAFFAKFIKNAEDKNTFVKEAILRHIKRHKKKG